MRSKANIKSHPIHPILVSLPIAFFIGCLVFDIIGYLNNRASFHQTAYYLTIAGVVGGALAAVPGIIDYIYTVPPKSSGKKRARIHGLLNTSLILIFITAFFYRQSDSASMMLTIALEATGVIIMSFSGWMGGTLVYRNQIGVDIRYAQAGKWKEKYTDEGGKIVVAKSGELKPDQMKLVHVRDKRIVVALSEKGWVAFDDRCTHRGGSLAGGAMICGTVQCPWHGSQFDVHTGSVRAGPAIEGIRCYKVVEEAGQVVLEVGRR